MDSIYKPPHRELFDPPQATLTPSGLEGAVQLTWLGAGARMGGLSEAGDYRLLVNGRGATADLRIEPCAAKSVLRHRVNGRRKARVCCV